MKRILTAIALSRRGGQRQRPSHLCRWHRSGDHGTYDPTGTTSIQTGGLRNATLSTTAGVLTATFLGFEALDTDTYTFSAASGTMTNKTAIPNVTNIFGNVAAGLLNFTFADLFAGTTVGNGGSGGGAGMFNSYMVLGTGTGAAFAPYTAGRAVRPGPRLQRLAAGRRRLRRLRRRPEGRRGSRARNVCADARRPGRGRLHCPPPSSRLTRC